MSFVTQAAEAREPSAALEPLLRIVGPDMAEVNAIILAQARSDVELIPELARHLINSGGKRLRPMLTIGAAKMCGYRGGGHIKLAAAVEFMHTATLLHDDVVDESELRRGKKSARILWGNQASVLVGDFLLGQAFRMMVEVGSLPALDILSAASCVIAEGEVMQLAASKDMTTTEEQYLAVIASKTAALFAAAAEVGGVVAGRSEAEQAALRVYGHNIGLAFQLIDDALDYSGEAALLGKSVGDDFREGKITLPVVLRTAVARLPNGSSGGVPCRMATFRKAIWPRRLRSCAATTPSATPSSARAFTAARRRRRLRFSRIPPRGPRFSAPWISASAAFTEIEGLPPFTALAA